MAKYYVKEIISDNKSITPEGFLLCLNSPIARTGELLYTAKECPQVTPIDNIVRIIRTPENIFTEKTLTSFEGKPLVMDHEDVTPDNFKEVTVGTVNNIRADKDNGLIVADILIMDADAIEQVQSGKITELSIGAECEVEQTSPGYGIQYNIIGNHVSLVENGRAGSQVAIQDNNTIYDLISTTDLLKLMQLYNKYNNVR